MWSVAKGAWLVIEGAWQSAVEDLLVAQATGCLARRHPRMVGGAVGRGDSAEDWKRASVVAESSYEEPSSGGASEEEGRRFAPEPSSNPSACDPGTPRGPYIGGGGPP